MTHPFKVFAERVAAVCLIWSKEFCDLPVAEQENYTFGGWYADCQLTELIKKDVSVDRAEITIYVKCIARSMTNDMFNQNDHFAYITYDTPE